MVTFDRFRAAARCRLSLDAVEKGFGILADIPADHLLRRMNRVVGQLICASAFARSTSALARCASSFAFFKAASASASLRELALHRRFRRLCSLSLQLYAFELAFRFILFFFQDFLFRAFLFRDFPFQSWHGRCRLCHRRGK